VLFGYFINKFNVFVIFISQYAIPSVQLKSYLNWECKWRKLYIYIMYLLYITYLESWSAKYINFNWCKQRMWDEHLYDTLVSAPGWKVQRLPQPSYCTRTSPLSVIRCTVPILPTYCNNTKYTTNCNGRNYFNISFSWMSFKVTSSVRFFIIIFFSYCSINKPTVKF
jgi:hypothetical protein